MSAAWRRFVEGPLTRGAIGAGHHVVRALGATWRVRHTGGDRVEEARRTAGPVLYVFTHGVLFPLSYTHRRRQIQVLISESRDGEIITRLTGNLGFGAVRGSSSRGGGRAVIRMASRAREGFDLAITPDGPRGPRGTVQAGAVLVSSRSQVPIVPVGVSASRGFRARSWDRFLIPAPFARVWVVYGESILAPTSPSEDRVLELTGEVERAMAAVETEAAELVRGARSPASSSGKPS